MSGLFFDDDDDDAPPVPPDDGGRRPRYGLRIFASLLLIAFVAVAGAGVWLGRRIDPPGPQGEPVPFVIEEGDTAGAVADDLEAAGVITDARLFRLYLRIEGGASFQAGDYTLRRDSSMGEVLQALGEGPEIDYTRVTVPEGLTLAEVAERVGRNPQFSAEAFLAEAESGAVRSRYQPEGVTSLEGLLFPETYAVTEQETERHLLERMVAALDETAAELGYDGAAERVGLTPYETIIVASLVEAEARVDEDRARISRVIHNRLAEDMRLDIDATVYYALGRRSGSLTESDLQVDSPYNTRRFPGLPPTPIAMPGRASLEAALNPEPGPWRYYVLADESGVHAFSETYDQFLRDRREAREKGLL